jgi:hypothetical protein
MPLAQADELGRLFFTPTERGQLEQEHTLQASESNTNEQPALTVNGLIQRGDGSSIVWINGTAQKTDTRDDPGAVPVTIAGKNIPVEIKVGQRFVPDSPAPINLGTQHAPKAGQP